eukprot:TRINITY_DN3648_c0_g1_i4.p1 TRINITY_DN3648_c0_g1~~TRINITY_DN3648_c0_g1_i4.p1  ORF type:complete len:314 (+),score=77.72 TRINITY_DN3648_c0_g1_i4:398-1339(+)
MEKKCGNYNMGCTATYPLEQEEAHKAQCPKELVKCPSDDCNELILREAVAAHVEVCSHRTVKCAHCQKNVQRARMQEHMESECTECKTSCPQCHTDFTFRDLAVHQQTACKEQIVSCTVPVCDVPRCDLPGHMASAAQQHVTQLCEKLQRMAQLVEQQQQQIAVLEQHVQLLDEMVAVIRVPHIRQLINGSRPNTCTFTTPDVTSVQGYCFNIQLYLTGDSVSKPDYIAVFFTPRPGRLDYLLEWPMPFSVLLSVGTATWPLVGTCFREFLAKVGRPDAGQRLGHGFSSFMTREELLRHTQHDDTAVLRVRLY